MVLYILTFTFLDTGSHHIANREYFLSFISKRILLPVTTAVRFVISAKESYRTDKQFDASELILICEGFKRTVNCSRYTTPVFDPVQQTASFTVTSEVEWVAGGEDAKQ
jgi:hypothetical protein